MKLKKVAIISIRGLPARYGAFEQTASQIIEYSKKENKEIIFYVGCENSVFEEPYDESIIRKGFKRSSGIGVIIYGLKTAIWSYLNGCRTFLIFGYALSPFFWIFSLFKIKIICNVDGIEWRRDKWSKIAKIFFKLCEKLAVKSSATLIYDSYSIKRYFNIIHKRKGCLIFYGSEEFDQATLSQIYSNEIADNLSLPENSYFVCVMRMEPENNIKLIVESYIETKTSKKLVLIGPSTNYFEKNILPLIKNKKNIKYLGPIYDRKVLSAIRANASCYIHGHKVGGTNPTLVEAIYLNRPIIAFRSIFNCEIVPKVYTFNSIDEMKNLLENDLFWNPSLFSLKNYSWKNICEKYINLMV